ncbi:hypothetical protein BHE90_008930 [Fusarium euwallaceae]|uniref:Ubiquitin 3 binding protein But2 C-terminal domain-containing protein n=5 Tax=Fusarium solani species complex TaxID=232080 RepID=A0A3M2SRA5_9HYPO|nr:hypothetical protein CDV36_000293 [Fusarium kuroshium]RSL61068.1 hypothetical protein CEP53_005231 [Fusarium sp. AF-6]RSL81631.1 hypothetical protein CEP51_005698 [Fusarium floridanum]RSM01178.1 hypothetical protein CEP52_008686 [Fusarium oligoseptatum]RSM01828.1 hypothetical protein CDV31_011177 [Fusarium ambrosium]RTE76589.1 hypothetical protein BHE90_008930 [Fusarium euwallaceae]
MPSLTNIFTSLACLMAVVNGMPTINIARQTADDCSTSETTRHGPAANYNVFPKYPDLAKNALGFHLETYNNASQVEQVVVFKGIPANAKDCSVGWDQGERISRTFIVKGGDALAGVRQLSGFPEGAVTYNSVQPFDNAEKDVGGADFTNWDDLAPQGHLTGGIDCAETLYLKVALRNPDGNTKVFLGQDDTNGLHITYSC